MRATGERIVTRVWFSAEAIERVRRESYAEIQTEQEARGGFEVTMETFSLEWLARWLLSFGSETEALAPSSLREMVQREAKALLWRYDQGAQAAGKQKRRRVSVS